jgi:adenylate cyclase class 2
MENQEIEVKFFLQDSVAYQRRVEAAGAVLEIARVHEQNLRFDSPDRTLSSAHRVLRLRQDDQSVLTYKGPAESGSAVSIRQEIEFTVSDFIKARQLIEALGYQVMLMYEKYRTTWGLEGVHVTLDEMPYGTFTEIEGPSPEQVQTVANRLGLRWDARVNASYIELFERFKKNRGVDWRDLSFTHFAGARCVPEELGVNPGD